jgi:hypothetical protein
MAELPGRSACQSNRQVLTAGFLIPPYFYHAREKVIYERTSENPPPGS